jgi:chlorite dismutase
MAVPLHVHFVGGQSGAWRVNSVAPVTGAGLPFAERLTIDEAPATDAYTDAAWVLRGFTSNTRYTKRSEVDTLVSRQQGLKRPEATCAALIPIRKSAAWWDLAQDERRAIFEEQSRHIGIGMDYLPGVARRLHHSRELGEPFDFLTWFEYALEHARAFEDMVAKLRSTPEWQFVEREIDIRLSLD